MKWHFLAIALALINSSCSLDSPESPPTPAAVSPKDTAALESAPKPEVAQPLPVVTKDSSLRFLVKTNDVAAVKKRIANKGEEDGTADEWGRLPLHYATTEEMTALLWNRLVVLGELPTRGHPKTYGLAWQIRDNGGQKP